MTLRNRNLSVSNPSRPNGIFRATVTAVATDTISVKIPRLTGNVEYPDVSFYGDKPSVNDEIIVGFLEGNAGTPVAIIPSSSISSGVIPQGDIEGVTAGLGLSGGGTTGTISLAFAPSELSSVTVATDDKVVIADTSDSDNPKHVTVSSIAALATASPAGSDTQVQFNNSGSFGASSNMVFDGTNLDIAGLKIGGTAVTSTAAELNILDGVTSTTAELNILDGVTSTASELNLVDGITAGTVSASKAVIADSNSDVSSAGHFVAQTGGADGGIVLGQTYSASYSGLRTAGMSETSGDEYIIMSNGGTTFVSAGTNGDVHIRGGANSTSCQITLDTSENEISIDGDLIPTTDSTSDLGTTSKRWSQVHADHYYVDDTNTYIDFEADGGSGLDGPGIRFVINGNEMFKLARENDDSNHAMLLFGENNDGIFYDKSSEYMAFYRSASSKFEIHGSYNKWPATLPVVTSYSTLRRGTYSSTSNVVGYDGSSQRYKENITNFVKSDWENIYNLQAVRFNWKEEVAADRHASWGLISEDVYAQIPELGVMRVIEGVNDGNPVPDTVNYEQLCVFLIEAVKDLNTRLAALE